MKRIIFLVTALFAIMTMCACGKKEAAPLIDTTITPQNWAIAEDYGKYEVPVESEPTVEDNLPTEDVVEDIPEETEPVIEETEPEEEYYAMAKDDWGTAVEADLTKFTHNGVEYSLNELTLDVITNDWGMTEDTPISESGIMSDFVFEGYTYMNFDDASIVHVDADEDGNVRAIRFLNGDFKFLDGQAYPGMDMGAYYDIVEPWGVARFMPAEGVTASHGLKTDEASAYVRIGDNMMIDFFLFKADYINSWGPIY